MAFVLGAVSLAIASIAIYAAGFGIFSQNEYVATCLFLSVAISFFLFPSTNRWIAQHRSFRFFVDGALMLSATAALVNFIVVQNEIETGFYSLTSLDHWLGVIGIIVPVSYTHLTLPTTPYV